MLLVCWDPFSLTGLNKRTTHRQVNSLLMQKFSGKCGLEHNDVK